MQIQTPVNEIFIYLVQICTETIFYLKIKYIIRSDANKYNPPQNIEHKREAKPSYGLKQRTTMWQIITLVPDS